MPSQVKNLIVLLCLFSSAGYSKSDSTIKPTGRSWYLPVGVSTEYAGGFGLLSAGVVFNPLKKTEVSFTTGYIPPAYGNIWTFNTLISYTTLRIKLNKELTLHLLKAGGFVNFNFGKNIYLKWPSNYPDAYYWWNSSIRYGPFIDSELKYTPNESKFAYTFFFQCLTNDLYLASYVLNTRSLSISDILILGTGIKISLVPF